jgi:hypothetical protein
MAIASETLVCAGSVRLIRTGLIEDARGRSPPLCGAAVLTATPASLGGHLRDGPANR